MRVKRLSVSISMVVLMIDSIGVIPLPAATATCSHSAPGCRGAPKLPVGVMRSTTSPACSTSHAYVEKAPLSMRRTPIANSPEVADVQIE